MRIQIEYASKRYGTPDTSYLLGVHREPRSSGAQDNVVLAMRCGMRAKATAGEAEGATIVLSLEEARQLRAALEHVIDGGTDALPRVIADGAASWEVQVEDARAAGLSIRENGGYDITNEGSRWMPYLITRMRSAHDQTERRVATFVALRPGERRQTNVMILQSWKGLAPTGEVEVMTIPVPAIRRP